MISRSVIFPLSSARCCWRLARLCCPGRMRLLILLAAWLVRRWLTHKGFPALEARSWHFTGTPILLRSFAVPVQRMCTVVGIYLAASSLPWAIPGVRKLFLMAFQLVMTLLVCEACMQLLSWPIWCWHPAARRSAPTRPCSPC